MMTNYARFFERKTRDNGETFYSLSDDCPDWLYDAVRDAHDGELPNDWRYDTCHSIVADVDEGSDHPGELAHSLVDVYTSDLLQWLAGDVSRTAYTDGDLDDPDSVAGLNLVALVRLGQYRAIEIMAVTLLDAIAENSTD